jgi:hypothetical protein
LEEVIEKPEHALIIEQNRVASEKLKNIIEKIESRLQGLVSVVYILTKS